MNLVRSISLTCICIGVWSQVAAAQVVLPPSSVSGSATASYKQAKPELSLPGAINIRAAQIRRAGLQKDRSQASLLIEQLKPKAPTTFYVVILHALALTEATEALPMVEDIAYHREGLNPYLHAYAKVTYARMLADRAGRVASQDKPGTIVTTFLREVGLSASQLSEPRPDQNRYKDDDVKLKVLALRELADIGYSRRDASVIEAAKKQGVNFAVDEPAELKARLAPSSSDERVKTIIDILASRLAVTGVLGYTIQLAANEGMPASHEAATRLRALVSVADDNERLVGLNPLIGAIVAVGDAEQIPLFEELTKHKNRWVRGAAQSRIGYLKTGEPLTEADGF